MRLQVRAKSIGVITLVATLAGCERVDLVMHEMKGRTCGDSVSYAFKIENRDWGGNILATPGNFGSSVAVQAYTSTDDAFGGPDQLAGGTTVFPASFGSDGVLTPGETSECVFFSADFPAAGPYLLLTVDHQDRVDEYNDANNTRAALMLGCPDRIGCANGDLVKGNRAPERDEQEHVSKTVIFHFTSIVSTPSTMP